MKNTTYGKRHSTHKGWTLYHNGETFYAFLPGESPSNMDTPEWEDDSLDAIKAFIACY